MLSSYISISSYASIYACMLACIHTHTTTIYDTDSSIIIIYILVVHVLYNSSVVQPYYRTYVRTLLYDTTIYCLYLKYIYIYISLSRLCRIANMQTYNIKT